MEQVFGAIPLVLEQLEQHEKIDAAVVFAAWVRCAGEVLSKRTIAVDFSAKKLIIAVADITWQKHLELLSPQMLAKMNSSLGQGTVRFIEFQIDEKTLKRAQKKSGSKSNTTSNPVSSTLVDASMAIADENLRKTFLDTAGEYLARHETLRSEI